jgi:hypothetical protein
VSGGCRPRGLPGLGPGAFVLAVFLFMGVGFYLLIAAVVILAILGVAELAARPKWRNLPKPTDPEKD